MIESCLLHDCVTLARLCASAGRHARMPDLQPVRKYDLKVCGADVETTYQVDGRFSIALVRDGTDVAVGIADLGGPVPAADEDAYVLAAQVWECIAPELDGAGSAIVTGHGMGGAVAVWIAWWLHVRAVNTMCVTFGATAPSPGLAIRDVAQELDLIRIVNIGDTVPSESIPNAKQFGEVWNLSESGELLGDDRLRWLVGLIEWACRLLPRRWRRDRTNRPAHAIGEYVRRLELARDNSSAHELWEVVE